jgi:NAD(P)-dependent dehydrogenase (short-subunit alcohol dehydrogenase family)
MDLQIAGKRALVTGSSQGIGEAIAKALAREGAVVVVHGRDAQRANRVADDIAAAGGRAFVVLGNLATDQNARAVCERALGCAGGIDILVNNAGAYQGRGWMDSEPSDWADAFNKNVLSVVRMVYGLVPQMKAAGWGRIIQMASCVAARPLAVMPEYSAAKAALLNVTASLALELADSGITVNSIGAGLVMTPGTARHFQKPSHNSGPRPPGSSENPTGSTKASQRVFIALGRPGSVDEVANLVTFLCSPLAGYIHGANLPVDGGYIGPAA